MSMTNLKDLWLPDDHPCLGAFCHMEHGQPVCNNCGKKMVTVDNGKRWFHPDTPALTHWLAGTHPDQQKGKI